ncbi:hypothetical protein CTAM01_12402, partial [Colletotrichum tamarilloi]
SLSLLGRHEVRDYLVPRIVSVAPSCPESFDLPRPPSSPVPSVHPHPGCALVRHHPPTTATTTTTTTTSTSFLPPPVNQIK